MACAMAQTESEEGEPIAPSNDDPVSYETTVANDAIAPSDENVDTPSEEPNKVVESSQETTASEVESENVPVPEAAPESPTESNAEPEPSNIENQENPSSGDDTDAQNNSSEASEVATTASTVDDGDSNEANSNSETDSNLPDDSNDNSAATTSPDISSTDGLPASSSENPTTDTPASPTPAPEFTCQSVGRFPHPDSCEKYYYCWDTVHSYAEFSCHRAFDPVNKLCVNNYAACPLAPTCEADKQVFPFPDDKSAFFECKLEKDDEAVSPVYEIRKEECARGREFNAELGYCTTPPSETGSTERFECTGVGIFIDYSSEIHYIECVIKSISKGTLKAIRRKCPKYTVFSAVDKQCVPL